jgi:hypothetical protein
MLKDMALESLGRMIPSLESSDIRHTPIEYTPRASEPESSDTECVKTESIPAPNELCEFFNSIVVHKYLLYIYSVYYYFYMYYTLIATEISEGEYFPCTINIVFQQF